MDNSKIWKKQFEFLLNVVHQINVEYQWTDKVRNEKVLDQGEKVLGAL